VTVVGLVAQHNLTTFKPPADATFDVAAETAAKTTMQIVTSNNQVNRAIIAAAHLYAAFRFRQATKSRPLFTSSPALSTTLAVAAVGLLCIVGSMWMHTAYYGL